MNMYDMIQVDCSCCGKWIGEIEYDSKVQKPKCGVCDNPTEASILTTTLNSKAQILYKKVSGIV